MAESVFGVPTHLSDQEEAYARNFFEALIESELAESQVPLTATDLAMTYYIGSTEAIKVQGVEQTLLNVNLALAYAVKMEAERRKEDLDRPNHR